MESSLEQRLAGLMQNIRSLSSEEFQERFRSSRRYRQAIANALEKALDYVKSGKASARANGKNQAILARIPDEELRKDASYLSGNEMARKYGIRNSSVVYEELQRRKISKFGAKNWNRDSMILAGCPAAEIAEAEGVIRTAISNYIHYHNLAGIWYEAKKQRKEREEQGKAAASAIVANIACCIDHLAQKRIESQAEADAIQYLGMHNFNRRIDRKNLLLLFSEYRKMMEKGEKISATRFSERTGRSNLACTKKVIQEINLPLPDHWRKY
ncbi:MAG TPA: hypothetical protein VJJ75_02585 [Candidatus Nanoarchaeia archaeon]|nr:hypothetical protein [Candidatus Nanoarchaeia archaeon]